MLLRLNPTLSRALAISRGTVASRKLLNQISVYAMPSTAKLIFNANGTVNAKKPMKIAGHGCNVPPRPAPAMLLPEVPAG